MKTKPSNFLVTLLVVGLLLGSCSKAPAMNTPAPATRTVTPAPEPSGTPTSSPIPPTLTPTLIPETAFIKGITLNYGGSGPKLGTTDAQEVIQKYIIPSGANYVILVPTCWSSTMSDTNIVCSNERIEGGVPPVSDEELIKTIQYLHSVGLRVALKPQALIQTVHIAEQERKERHWGESQRKAWFDNYNLFITHYAQLSEGQQVDLFVVGNEQEDNTKYEQDWRRVIYAVRDIYHGPITYAANAWSFEAAHIKFWDALDYIGTNGYQFGYVHKKDPTVEDMIRNWQPYIQRLEEMSKEYGKQVIITEIGAMSMEGYNSGGTNSPGWKATPYDGQEQADYYTALFEALKGKSWLKGIILWSLSTDPLQGGPNDISDTFVAKPAEQVVREYFGGSAIAPTPIPPEYVEDPAHSMLLYADGLGMGWRPWNEPDAKIVADLHFSGGHESRTSIRVPLSKYKELQLVYDTPYIEMSKYKWIEFYLKVGKHEPKNLLVMFGYWTPETYTSSRKISVGNFSYIEGGYYRPDTWQRIRIPLADLGISDQIFNEFHIMACDWPCALDPGADDIYVDDIRLVAGKSP